MNHYIFALLVSFEIIIVGLFLLNAARLVINFFKNWNK